MIGPGHGEDDQEGDDHAVASPVERLVQSDGGTEAGNGETEGGSPVAAPVGGDPVLAHRIPEWRQPGGGQVQVREADHGDGKSGQVHPPAGSSSSVRERPVSA